MKPWHQANEDGHHVQTVSTLTMIDAVTPHWAFHDVLKTLPWNVVDGIPKGLTDCYVTFCYPWSYMKTRVLSLMSSVLLVGVWEWTVKGFDSQIDLWFVLTPIWLDVEDTIWPLSKGLLPSLKELMKIKTVDWETLFWLVMSKTTWIIDLIVMEQWRCTYTVDSDRLLNWDLTRYALMQSSWKCWPVQSVSLSLKVAISAFRQ